MAVTPDRVIQSVLVMDINPGTGVDAGRTVLVTDFRTTCGGKPRLEFAVPDSYGGWLPVVPGGRAGAAAERTGVRWALAGACVFWAIARWENPCLVCRGATGAVGFVAVGQYSLVWNRFACERA